MCCINLFLVIFELWISVIKLLINFFKLWGGILVVIFIVILEELLRNSCGIWEGSINGFCWELLKLLVKFIVFELIFCSIVL